MDSLKQAGEFVTDKVNAATAGASKEANKATAKDSNQSIGDRLKGAGNTAKDKANEKSYDASAEANKQAATH